ncbi:ThuA domain-containing protein [Streptomyces sp. NPDC126514]|uniref:ThuA domain-containing protein n=1 Tax=Streptomyces sp. NPDC126514 TaxID=3155210 RepID=UPI00331BCC31
MSYARRQALVVRGGRAGESPVRTTNLFLPFLRRQGFDVLVEDCLEVYEDKKLLAETDLVVQCWQGDDITPRESAGLRTAVQNGTGLAGWHTGLMNAFPEDLDYQLLVGGTFRIDPSETGRHRVRLAAGRADHPVLTGLTDFDADVVRYWPLTDPMIDVLATIGFDGDDSRPGVQAVPAVWTRTWGRGRVFASVLGAQPGDFDIPQVRTLTERGLLWAGR